MPSDGAAELARLGARLKVEGDGRLRRRTQAALRAGAQPMVPRVRQAALRDLPARNGLNQVIANRPISVVTSMTARGAGVRLKTQRTPTDKGTVRHPVPNTDVWVDQPVPNAVGWWSKTLEDSRPLVVAALRVAMAETAAAVEG